MLFLLDGLILHTILIIGSVLFLGDSLILHPVLIIASMLLLADGLILHTVLILAIDLFYNLKMASLSADLVLEAIDFPGKIYLSISLKL